MHFALEARLVLDATIAGIETGKHVTSIMNFEGPVSDAALMNCVQTLKDLSRTGPPCSLLRCRRMRGRLLSPAGHQSLITTAKKVYGTHLMLALIGST